MRSVHAAHAGMCTVCNIDIDKAPKAPSDYWGLASLHYFHLLQAGISRTPWSQDTIFHVFGMTRPGLEPWPTDFTANDLTITPQSQLQYLHNTLHTATIGLPREAFAVLCMKYLALTSVFILNQILAAKPTFPVPSTGRLNLVLLGHLDWEIDALGLHLNSVSALTIPCCPLNSFREGDYREMTLQRLLLSRCPGDVGRDHSMKQTAK